MKQFFLVLSAIPFFTIIFQSCSKEKDDPVTPSVSVNDTIAEAQLFAGVWVDSVDSSRKITFANILGSNYFIGTDELYGDPHVINLNGVTNNRNLSYTVIIKYQPTGFNKWYIEYQGIITDTSFANKRIKVYSVLDTLYLKPE